MAEVGAAGPLPAIVFVGFMAAGKTNAARTAAERLGVEAIDADEVLAERLGRPIPAFFEAEGEEEFRRLEQELVLELLDAGGVIALGGGAVESEPVRGALAAHVCAWCQVNEQTAWDRAAAAGDRPLASDRNQFRRRFEARAPLYESVARAILPRGGRDIGGAAAPWLAAMRTAAATRMVWAEAGSAEYPAIVGEGAVALLDSVRETLPDELPARSFAIADRAALSHHPALPPRCEALVEVEGGEASKTLNEAERVLEALVAAGARRDDLLLALGGGVVGDLGGFCAATYQRGVAVVQAPTTLVAQVDSAYGGKTGVDLAAGKNYVGAFHQPLAVLADPSVLSTLPPEELAAGHVEVLKTALIAGGELWERVRSLDMLELVRGGGLDELSEIVFACARTKIEVVASDERDAGRRAVLNLGHTVGHAIEAATGYERYRHGEAVGLGLLAALRLSDADQLRSEVRERLEAHGLPVTMDSSISVDEVLEAAGRDKKRTAEGLGFVLLERPGEPRWGQQVDPARVRQAVEELR
ncbi:MAG: 3-dehydroquinate synthase [Solirubrobacterales bacterium]|nr:3-dehydroquinate synthase [Solirubrobacterales bacterium]